MKKVKLLVVLSLLAQVGFGQFLGKVTYHQKAVYNKVMKADSSLKSYTIDTIKYQVPFEVSFTQKSVMIDGYGSFPVATYEKRGDSNSVFHYYKITDGSYVTIGEKVMYLCYPIVNLRMKIIIFDID